MRNIYAGGEYNKKQKISNQMKFGTRIYNTMMQN